MSLKNVYIRNSRTIWGRISVQLLLTCHISRDALISIAEDQLSARSHGSLLPLCSCTFPMMTFTRAALGIVYLGHREKMKIYSKRKGEKKTLHELL